MTWNKALEFLLLREIEFNKVILNEEREIEYVLMFLIDDNDGEYKSLTQRVSQQVFHINGNITSIERLVAFLGTSRDNPDVRNKL